MPWMDTVGPRSATIIAVPTARLERDPVQRFITLLNRPATRAALRAKGFEA